MRSIFVSIALVVGLSGCASQRTSVREDAFTITYEWVFPSHGRGNPYSADELGKANAYIEERIEHYKLGHVMEAYLLPTPYSNRLVFVRMRSGDEPSKAQLQQISEEVERFLDAFVRTRPWNISPKEKPNQVPEPMSGLAPGHGSS